MKIEIELTEKPIARPQIWAIPVGPETGSLVEFYGIVREIEGDARISTLGYEAYASMADKIMREKIAAMEEKFPCQAIRVVHRLGRVPAGESAIYVGIHRSTAGKFFSFFRNSWMSQKGRSDLEIDMIPVTQAQELIDPTRANARG